MITTALNDPLLPTTLSSLSPTKQRQSQHLWLKYALASFFFGAIGQFSMGFMSENIFSRFILSLGNFIFVIFYGFGKYLYFHYKNKRWATLKDCAWCDESGHLKEGTFKYMLLAILSRLFYGFAIIIAFSYANASNMNIGIVLSVRSSEALFVALWTFLVLQEKLSPSKILGLFILTGGVIGLSLPKGTGEGFSMWAILWALISALISAVRNFTVKALTKKKVDGETITFHAVFWADLITVFIGVICCIWGYGFNHEYYDNYLQQQSVELTWRRFWFSIFVGFAVYFSLTTTANANQYGYAGKYFLFIIL